MSSRDYQTYHIEIDQGSIAVHFRGNIESHNAIIYLHGHLNNAFESGNYEIFERPEDNLLHIFLDHRWHGSSTRLEFYPKISERAIDIDLLLESLQGKFKYLKDIRLIGYSQGGSVLMYYLANNFKLNSLVSYAFLLAPRINAQHYLKWFEEGIKEMEFTGNSEFSKKYRSKGLIKYNNDFVDEFMQLNFYGEVRKVKTKTFLLRGSQDELVLRDEAIDLVKQNPLYLSYTEIPNCSHFPKTEHWHSIYKQIYQLPN